MDVKNYNFIKDIVLESENDSKNGKAAFKLLSKLEKLTLKKYELDKHSCSALQSVVSRIKLFPLNPQYKNATAIVLKKTNSSTGVDGWGLLFNKNADAKNVLNLYMYVKSNCRKQGIGTKILKEAMTICKDNNYMLQVSPWSDESRSFYKKFIKKNSIGESFVNL